MFGFVTEIIGAVISLEIGERLFGNGRRSPDPAARSIPAAEGSNTRVLFRRLFAFVMDLLLVFAGCYLVLGLGRLGASLSLLAAFAVFVLYRAAFEALLGRTPAKALLGLRVVTAERPPKGGVSASRAMLRNVLVLIDLALISSVVGLLIPLATGRNQRIGDLAAGTLVIGEDGSAREARASEDREPERRPRKAARGL